MYTLFIDVASFVCLRHQATDSIVMTSRDPYLGLFTSAAARVKTIRTDKIAFRAFSYRACGVFISFMGLYVDISMLWALFVVRDESMREGKTTNIPGFY